MSGMTATAGATAEALALRLLEQQGYRLVTKNFRCRQGEIDLIVTRGDWLVFVEVRLRRTRGWVSAAESITPTKQARILHTAQVFLCQQPQWQSCNLRFDVVLFSSLDQTPEWIQGAFDAI